LGQIDDGIEWFNNYNILGNPGGSPVGWSSNSAGVGNDTRWVDAKHSLEGLKGKTPVQFRITYGSDGTAHNNSGIAFDDVWIGRQNRVALMEHFTNASDVESKNANVLLNNLVNEDTLNIIDLQYHTSFPGDDPFNEQEPYAPGARVVYYGLPDVPYSILNGGYTAKNQFDYNGHPLDANTVHIESLLESIFTININSHLTLDQTGLVIEIQVAAQTDIPAKELTIHIAMIERKITEETGINGETVFESVVKALLPDAAGTTVSNAWSMGDQYEVKYTWTIENLYNFGELRVVAFIQDESTGEVYQAAIRQAAVSSATTEIPAGLLNKFVVFPNPASDQVFVRFEKPVTRDVRIDIYNNLGSLIYSGKVPPGEIETQISTGFCPDGIYIIRAITNDQILGTRKLTITR